MIEKWKKELAILEAKRDKINSKKRELGKKIANLKKKIAIYITRANLYDNK